MLHTGVLPNNKKKIHNNKFPEKYWLGLNGIIYQQDYPLYTDIICYLLT